MIQRNNNLSVLPFYGALEEQNHRKSYAYGEVYPLYTPIGSVPPFQIIYEKSAATITEVTLMKPDGQVKAQILSSMNAAGLRVMQFATEDYSIIIFPSVAPMNITQDEGEYYVRLTMSDGKVFYSDIFVVTGNTSGFLNVQWYDLQDMIMDNERIVYVSDGNIVFRNTLWLATQLGKPDYEFDEEGEERDGRYFPEKMISQKKYRFTILASEYLCDVMRFIRLSDRVTVTDQFGHVYNCDTFLITPKWETQGDLASVEVEFTCATVAKKIGRGYPMGHSFNDDYNNDYDIEEIEVTNN